jgi:hypothetical protein
MSDPRAENCRAYHLAPDGRVDGVKLEYVPNPSTKYELIRCELIPEGDAGDTTVAHYQVLDKDNLMTGERVYLAWPWPEIKFRQLPGNANGQHMIINGYDAAAGKVGPLALFVGDAKGEIISDVIGGLGLPNNRHVCYRLVWRERGAGTVTPPPPPEGGGGSATENLGDVVAAIDRLTAAVRAAFKPE